MRWLLNKAALLGFFLLPFVSNVNSSVLKSPAGIKGLHSPWGNIFTLIWEPNEGENVRYNIYRRETLFGPTEKITSIPIVSTAFADWTDSQPYYYSVRQVDQEGAESPDSLIVESSPQVNLIAVAPDRKSYVSIAGGTAEIFQAEKNRYGVPLTLSIENDFASETQEVAGAIHVKVLRHDTGEEIHDILLAGKGAQITWLYQTLDGKVIRHSGFATLDMTPRDLSIYWNNGLQWMPVGGQLNENKTSITVQSAHLGRFQLKGAARTTGLNLPESNVYPKTFTPNDDGFNDRIFWLIENPNQITVQGRVTDTSGRTVASLQSPSPQSPTVTMTWDGRDQAGANAPIGEYIYIIEGENSLISGLISLAR